MTLFSCLLEENNLPEHKHRIDIVTPVSGNVATLDDLPNLLFSQRMFGEGAALSVSGYQVVAPFSGMITEFGVSAHRIRIKHKNGLHLQVYCGMGSEKLRGEGFKRKVKEGQQVNQGDVLLEFDIRKMKLALECSQFAVTILNSEKTKGLVLKPRKVSAGEDILMSVLI